MLKLYTVEEKEKWGDAFFGAQFLCWVSGGQQATSAMVVYVLLIHVGYFVSYPTVAVYDFSVDRNMLHTSEEV